MPTTKIHRWTWTDKPLNVSYKDTYRLEFYSVDNTQEMPESPEIINENIKSLDEAIYKTESSKFMFGRENSPVMNIELELKYLSENLKTMLNGYPQTYDVFIPFGFPQGYEISTLDPVLEKNVIAYHIWSLYLNDNLVWIGVQNSTLEGNYNDGILSIEIHALAKVVTSLMSMNDCVYLALLSDTDYIKEAKCAYDCIFKTDVNNGAGVSNKTVAYASISAPNDYYYFVRKSKINDLLNYIYKEIAVAITRNYFNDTLFNNAIPEITNTTYYKQNYQSILARGDALNENDLYILGFVANDSLANRTLLSWRLRASFYSKLDSFKNLWDYLGILAQENLVRMTCETASFSVSKIFDGHALIADNQIRNITDGDLNIDAEILERTEAACTEKYQRDNDRIEYIGYGNRSQNSDNLTTIYNQNVSLRDDKTYSNGGFYSLPGGIAAGLKLTGGNSANAIVVHSLPAFLKYYYFERPKNSGYLTTEIVPIGANHNVKISFNADNSFTSDDFDTIITTSFDFESLNFSYYGKDALFDGLSRLHRLSGGKLYCIAKSYSSLMNGRVKRQISYENTFDKISSYQSGLAVVNTFSNAFLANKIRRFKFDFANIDAFLGTVNNIGFVVECEQDLTCKGIESGYKVLTKYKILVTNYE